jgi:hypothetical protein
MALARHIELRAYVVVMRVELSIKIYWFGILKNNKLANFGPFFPWKILCIG